MPTILETPQSLCRREADARTLRESVVLSPSTVRQIADSWHADQEKIKYLESLIVRMGKAPVRNGEVPTPPIPWTSPIYDPSKCAKCGLKMEGVMGYVCPQGGSCPTGLGGFSCGVSSTVSRNAG